jgi:hypothetical protein
MQEFLETTNEAVSIARSSAEDAKAAAITAQQQVEELKVRRGLFFTSSLSKHNLSFAGARRSQGGAHGHPRVHGVHAHEGGDGAVLSV